MILLAVGAVVSIVNAVTDNRLLGLNAESVTLMRQLLCNHVESASNVIVLLPEMAELLALEQSHEYVMVPASLLLNVYCGVV